MRKRIQRKKHNAKLNEKQHGKKSNEEKAASREIDKMAKAKLKLDDQTLIVKFPRQIDLLLNFHNLDIHQEFTDELKFE